MVVAALIIAKALFEILLVGTKTETVPGESNVVFISSINIGLFLSNKPARKHSARRLQVKDPQCPEILDMGMSSAANFVAFPQHFGGTNIC